MCPPDLLHDPGCQPLGCARCDFGSPGDGRCELDRLGWLRDCRPRYDTLLLEGLDDEEYASDGEDEGTGGDGFDGAEHGLGPPYDGGGMAVGGRDGAGLVCGGLVDGG